MACDGDIARLSSSADPHRHSRNITTAHDEAADVLRPLRFPRTTV
jgi:hypothetical protein